MIKRKSHTHKLHKIEISGDKVFACAFPECDGFMPKHYQNTLLGKMTICWQCDKPFIFDERAASMDMPCCIDCVTGISDEVLVKIMGETHEHHS